MGSSFNPQSVVFPPISVVGPDAALPEQSQKRFLVGRIPLMLLLAAACPLSGSPAGRFILTCPVGEGYDSIRSKPKQRSELSVLHKISGCEDTARKADVLFIHGLGGDARATWRHGAEGSPCWLKWLGEEFPEVGVWSLGYAASPTRLARVPNLLMSVWFLRWFLRWLPRGSSDSGYAMALPRRANQVLDLMVQNGFGVRPVVFVCHSLGGLLTKQILRVAAEANDASALSIFSQTRAVLFLATPHGGATLASLVKTFSIILRANVNIEDLRAHDAHLEELYNWYRNHAVNAGIRTVTYYEARPVCGFTIVNPTSSHPGVGADPVALDEDHLSIAKPRLPDAQVCCALRRLLREHALLPQATALAHAAPPPQQAALRAPDTSSVQIFLLPVVGQQAVFIQPQANAGLPAITISAQGLSVGNISGPQNAIPLAASGQQHGEHVGEEIIRLYEQRALDFARQIDEALDLDFPTACTVGTTAETWIGENNSHVPRESLALLYRQLARITTSNNNSAPALENGT